MPFSLELSSSYHRALEVFIHFRLAVETLLGKPLAPKIMLGQTQEISIVGPRISSQGKSVSSSWPSLHI